MSESAENEARRNVCKGNTAPYQRVSHHKRQEYCRTRLQYRQGRQLKAVKVYTVANESQHLLVFGVPKINLQQELKHSIQRFGRLELVQIVTEQLAKKIELELFTDVFHVKYAKIADARRAKRLLDAQQFYGGILHISYAPEYESTAELRQKFQQRAIDINYRISINTKQENNPPAKNIKYGEEEGS